MAVRSYLAESWSATEFGTPDLEKYASKLMYDDTRNGVQVMALLSLVVQLCVPIIILNFSLQSVHIYTYIMIALLSIHVLVSAHFVTDIRALHCLGMVLLILSALAVAFLAHRTGQLNIGMMAAIIMLFISMPLVPWGTREAVTVIGLTYLLLTASLISVPGKFDHTSLWALQALVIGTSFIVTVIVAKNAYLRKQDIRSRFELENARRSMEILSLKDHLTGAWNRRYLETRFDSIVERSRASGRTLHIAVLDIDDFKLINDSYGHHQADEILAKLGEIFMRHLGDDGCLVRLGGDEFQIIYSGSDLRSLVDAAVAELQLTLPASAPEKGDTVTLSAGFTSVAPGATATLDDLYKDADHALYCAKQGRLSVRPMAGAMKQLAQTGSWRL